MHYCAESYPLVVSYVDEFTPLYTKGMLPPTTIEILKVDTDMLQSSEQGVLWPDGIPKVDAAMIWCVSDSAAVHRGSLRRS